jgi:hypothetical protein
MGHYYELAGAQRAKIFEKLPLTNASVKNGQLIIY